MTGTTHTPPTRLERHALAKVHLSAAASPKPRYFVSLGEDYDFVTITMGLRNAAPEDRCNFVRAVAVLLDIHMIPCAAPEPPSPLVKLLGSLKITDAVLDMTVSTRVEALVDVARAVGVSVELLQ